jgi:hypothetical protein
MIRPDTSDATTALRPLRTKPNPDNTTGCWRLLKLIVETNGTTVSTFICCGGFLSEASFCINTTPAAKITPTTTIRQRTSKTVFDCDEASGDVMIDKSQEVAEWW